MHFGVDVSSNNAHPINYAAVVAYLRNLGGGAQPFVIVKVNEGTGYINPDENEDVIGFRAAGAVVAGYLMDHGSAAVADEEATYKRVASSLPQTDDIEISDGLGAQAYAAHTAQLIAQDPNALIYLNQSEVAEGFPTGAGLWLADYNGVPGYTPYPVTIHQYSSSTTIPGSGGQWDLNVWCASEERFANFFTGAPMPTPAPTKPVPAPCVGMARIPDGKGYWLVGSDGGVFSYGDAAFHGSLGGVKLAKPIVGMAATPTGKGYWLVGSDGGVFCFGDASFHGSTGNEKLVEPVVGIVPTPSGAGYWLVAGDCGVFSFGDAHFYGSAAA